VNIQIFGNDIRLLTKRIESYFAVLYLACAWITFRAAGLLDRLLNYIILKSLDYMAVSPNTGFESSQNQTVAAIQGGMSQAFDYMLIAILKSLPLAENGVVIRCRLYQISS
jgi:hypothetical protein